MIVSFLLLIFSIITFNFYHFLVFVFTLLFPCV